MHIFSFSLEDTYSKEDLIDNQTMLVRLMDTAHGVNYLYLIIYTFWDYNTYALTSLPCQRANIEGSFSHDMWSPSMGSGIYIQLCFSVKQIPVANFSSFGFVGSRLTKPILRLNKGLYNLNFFVDSIPKANLLVR